MAVTFWPRAGEKDSPYPEASYPHEALDRGWPAHELWVAAAEGKDHVAPTSQAATEGTYPIARPLYFYVPGEPQGAVKTFVDFVLSDDGQKVVVREDFVPLRKVAQ